MKHIGFWEFMIIAAGVLVLSPLVIMGATRKVMHFPLVLGMVLIVFEFLTVFLALILGQRFWSLLNRQRLE